MSNPYYKHPELDENSFLLKAGELAVLRIPGFTATTSEVRPLAAFLPGKCLMISAPLLAGHGTHPADLNKRKSQDLRDLVRHPTNRNPGRSLEVPQYPPRDCA